MQIPMKLYPLYDLDLIALKLDKTINLSKIAEAALIAYANGEDMNIPAPKNIDWSTYNYKPIAFHIEIDTCEEALVSALFMALRSRYRNSFIKMVMRRYMDEINIEGYFTNNTKIYERLIMKKPKKKNKKVTSDKPKNEKISEKTLLDKKDEPKPLEINNTDLKETNTVNSKEANTDNKENKEDTIVNKNNTKEVETTSETDTMENNLFDAFKNMIG